MNSFWSKHRAKFHERLPAYADIASLLIGVELALLNYFNFLGSFSDVLNKTSDWSISIIMLAGTMAGFSAASLAIVAGLSSSEKTKETIESPAGGFLISSLLKAMWYWLFSIFSPVIFFIGYSKFAISLFLFLLPICIVKTLIAYYAFHLLLYRYIKK